MKEEGRFKEACKVNYACSSSLKFKWETYFFSVCPPYFTKKRVHKQKLYISVVISEILAYHYAERFQ